MHVCVCARIGGGMRAHRLRHICDRCILGGVDPAAGECKPVNFCVFHTTVLVEAFHTCQWCAHVSVAVCIAFTA